MTAFTYDILLQAYLHVFKIYLLGCFYCLTVDTSLSFCLSVTFMYCVIMAKHIVTRDISSIGYEFE